MSLFIFSLSILVFDTGSKTWFVFDYVELILCRRLCWISYFCFPPFNTLCFCFLCRAELDHDATCCCSDVLAFLLSPAATLGALVAIYFCCLRRSPHTRCISLWFSITAEQIKRVLLLTFTIDIMGSLFWFCSLIFYPVVSVLPLAFQVYVILWIFMRICDVCIVAYVTMCGNGTDFTYPFSKSSEVWDVVVYQWCLRHPFAVLYLKGSVKGVL